MDRIIFFNVGWMSNYRGITNRDMIIGGGSYDNKDKGEVWNFKDFNGYCHGYVQPVSRNQNYDDATINLQNIDPSWEERSFIPDVTVVWVATNPDNGGSYIVGWYKNAIVYRNYHRGPKNKYGYYAKAKAEDCQLIDERFRKFSIPRATKENLGFMGQSNVWYAGSHKEEVEHLIERVFAYIKKMSY